MMLMLMLITLLVGCSNTNDRTYSQNGTASTSCGWFALGGCNATVTNTVYTADSAVMFGIILVICIGLVAAIWTYRGS